ncbi:hypothetical protein FUMI01_24910 [Flavobacterium sp. UMI-01]|nr:hypothetical protein FUMI01_24910 [Flavobacterium sp. UMI-01]
MRFTSIILKIDSEMGVERLANKETIISKMVVIFYILTLLEFKTLAGFKKNPDGALNFTKIICFFKSIKVC